MPDELDDLLDQMASETDQASALKGRFRDTANVDPETYAKHIRTAAVNGVAPSVVASNPQPFETEAKATEYSPELVQEVSPSLAAWLVEHEDNVPVSRDDIPTLQKFEESARDRALKAEEQRVSEDNKRRGAGVYTGLGASVLGGIGTLASTIKDAQAATIRATVGNIFGNGAVETLETVGKVNPLQWAIEGLDLGGKKLSGWAKQHEYETENLVVKDPKTGEEFLNLGAANPSNPKGLMNAAKIIAGELAPTAATIGLAVATGGAGAAGAAPKAGRLLALAQRIGQYAVSAPGLLEVGRTVQGQYQNGVQFLMSKDPTLSQEDAEIKAAPGALLAGLLSGPTGAAMEGKILEDLMTKVAKAPGAQSIIKKWGSKLLSLGITGAKEGAQEVVQGFAEDLADWVTINPDKTLVQVAGNAIQNLTGGVAMGAGMRIAIPGGHGPDKPVGTIQDLVDAAKESKLLKRSPEKFREAAGSMLQGETTLIEPTAFMEYFQGQGLDPYVMAEKVGVKNLDEALASGNPLIMETADYLTQLAVDHHEGLAPDLRTSIGEWTPRMAEENAAALETAQTEMVQAQKAIESTKELSLKEQIREDLVKKFDPLFEPSTAGTYADAFANILATFEVRSGKDMSKWLKGLTLSRLMEGERGMSIQDVMENRLKAQAEGAMFQAATPEEMQVRRQKESELSLAYNPEGSRPVPPAPAPMEALFHGSSAQDLAPGDLSIAHANPNSYFGSGIYMGSRDVAEGHVIRGDKGSIHEIRPKMEAPIDLGTDKIYTVEELKSIGIESSDEMSGFRAWRELIKQHGGNNGARDYLMSRGYDGVRFTNGSDPNPAYVAWTQDAIGENIPLSSFMKNRNMETGGQNAIPSEPGTRTGTGEGGGLRSSDWQPIDLASAGTAGRDSSGVGQTLYQSAPTFYSALERTVPDLSKIASKDGMVSPDQAKSWLSARQKEGKFKQAELDAVGLSEWLDLQKGKVSVNDVKNFVAQNGVQIQEVMKEGGDVRSEEDRARELFDDDWDSDKYEDWLYESRKMEASSAWNDDGHQVWTILGKDKAFYDGDFKDFRNDVTSLPTSDVIQLEEYDSLREEAWTQFSVDYINRILEEETISEESSSLGKFASYQLPGGKNYKELLLTFPVKAGSETFKGQHWDEPNVLSHIRFNERTDTEGKKVLFIEEIQSDWGQKGKKEGFGPKIPSAPFVTDTKAWVSLSLKRMIRYAAENGFDKVAFVNGEQSADRYDLSKSIDSIQWAQHDDGKFSIGAMKDGSQQIGQDNLTIKEVSDLVGKDIADKIQKASETEIDGELAGVDLKVGGEGMKTFYDKIVPQVAGEVLKKMGGGKITEVNMEADGGFDVILPNGKVVKTADTRKEAEATAASFDGARIEYLGKPSQPGFDITPEMKAKVMEEGQTLFQDDRQRRARQAMGRTLSPSGQGAELNRRADEARMSEASFRAWEEEIKAIQLGDTHEGKRGFIHWGADYQTHVGLFASANLSTAIHEIGGHFAFEILADLAQQEGVPQQIKDDYQGFLEASGYGTHGNKLAMQAEAKAIDTKARVEGRELTSVEAARIRELAKPHETFARLSEAYVMEGKAPSEELREAFARMKEWMKLIYRQLKNLGVKLSPEIRAAFDRMYATDEAIAQAREQTKETRKLIAKPEDVGWDQATFDLYQKTIAKAQERAAVAVEQKLIAEAQRQHEDWYKAERESVRADVETGVDSRKDFKDLKALQRGQLEDGTPMKLDRAQIVALIGEKETQAISRSKGAVYIKEGGVDIDSAAEIMGYDSGRQLVETLAGMPKRAELIERLTDEIMKAKHGDMATDGTLADESILAVHQKADEEALMMELKAFNAKAKEVAPFLKKQEKDTKAKAKAAMDIPPLATFRAAAVELINSQKIMDIQPNRYLTTGRQESRKAFEAMGKQDFAAAAQAKKNELMNHFLYLEAVKARALAEKQAGKARDLAKAPAQQRVGKAKGDFLNQLNAILDQYEFAKIPLKDILAREKGREEWVNSQLAANGGEGNGIVMPDPILFNEIPKNYKELTPPELGAVMDMLNNIQAVARNQYRYTLGNEEAEFEAEKAQFISTAYANNKVKKVRRRGAYEGFWDKRMRQLRGIDAEMTKMEWLVDQLDGGDINGPARRNIKKPIDDASADRNALMKDVFAKVRAAFEARPKAERQGEIQEMTGIRLPGMDEDLNWLQLITFWLNMGNAENENVAMEGEGLRNVEGMKIVEDMRKAMRKTDWVFVQSVWDALESTKDALFQVEKQMTGLEPVAKTLTPFDVKLENGEVIHMRGGYFPLKADSTLDARGELMEDPFKHLSVGSMAPSTKTSASQKVTGATYRLLLDYRSILGPHLKSVVTRITMGEAIRNVSRFTADEDVRRALQETLNEEEAKQFKPWLQDMANTETVDEGPVMRWLMKRRSAMTTAVLIGNLGSLLIQGSDVVKPAMEILNWNPTKFFGVPGFAKAYFDVITNRSEMVKFIKDLSPNEMRFRADNYQRDLREMEEARGAFGEGNARVTQFLGQGFMVMDSLISFPAWLAKYRQGMDEHGNETQAVMEADRMVARRIQAGENRNMSQMFRRPGASKLFTTFMGDANTMYGIVASSVKSGNPARMTSALMAVVLAQMIGQMLKNRGPEDDEDWLPWMGEQTLKGVSGIVPVASDLMDVGINTIIKGRKADLRNPVIAALVKPFEAIGSVNKAMAGEKDPEEALIDALDAAGSWTGVPGTAQILRTWKYVHHVAEGEQQPESIPEALAGATLGPKPKKK